MNISLYKSFTFCLTLIFFIASCSSNKSKNIQEFQKPWEAEVTSKEYILQPSDEITISATRVPELHEQAQTIRPDGKISFETIGDVPVAGKTPSEVAELLAHG